MAKKFVVVAGMGITFNPPAVLAGLTAAQIADRKHIMVPHKDERGRDVKGAFTLKQPTSFKRGEVLELSDAVARQYADSLADPETGETVREMRHKNRNPESENKSEKKAEKPVEKKAEDKVPA